MPNTDDVKRACERAGLVFLGYETDTETYFLAAATHDGFAVQPYYIDEAGDATKSAYGEPQFWTLESARALVAALEADDAS